MKFTRTRYQHGSVRLVRRAGGTDAWEFRYRDKTQAGHPLRQMTFSRAEYPNEADVWRAVQPMLMRLNSETPLAVVGDPEFGTVIERYIQDNRLKEIAASKPGEEVVADLSYSTAVSYLSNLKHILARWRSTPLSKVKPAAVQDWLRELSLSPKTKGHIKALLHQMFDKAMLWELMPVGRNPMELVKIKGVSKRTRKPLILTVDQFWGLLDKLPRSYRTMALVAQCTGLRASEIVGLKWSDIDLDGLSMRVSRGVVHARSGRVKTEYSDDDLPLDAVFVEQLRAWREECPTSSRGLVFPSDVNGSFQHASTIQQDHLRRAGEALGLKGVGWHTFRHTYRSWLDATGAPIGVQQKLMRHAHVSTTMNVYGNALMESKREANSKVVQMALRAV